MGFQSGLIFGTSPQEYIEQYSAETVLRLMKEAIGAEYRLGMGYKIMDETKWALGVM
jgi:hypothetical protein